MASILERTSSVVPIYGSGHDQVLKCGISQCAHGALESSLLRRENDHVFSMGESFILRAKRVSGTGSEAVMIARWSEWRIDCCFCVIG